MYARATFEGTGPDGVPAQANKIDSAEDHAGGPLGNLWEGGTEDVHQRDKFP
jgi:hypothetical protein